MFKKITISFLLTIFLLASVFAFPVKAQEVNETWYNPSFTGWAIKVFDDSNPNEIFGERYTYAQVTWIIHSLEALTLGEELIACVNLSEGDLEKAGECIEVLREEAREEGESLNLGPTMAIASVTDTVLSTQPASGIEYIADTAAKLRIIPEAYAQGVGFEGLQPALRAWKVTRNMAYALSIIAIIVLSFMIMFRVKISPQVVITVQSALPKIVIALILITFSYAIAGLVIDFSYLLLGLIAALTKSVGVELTTLNLIDFFTKLVFGSGLFSSLILSLVLFLVFWAFAGAIVGGAAAFIPAVGPTAAGVGAILGGILFIILIIMMIVAALRTLWLLVKTVINILLLIIAAPIMILFGTISPTVGFGSWLRSLIANVLVFPTVKLMLFLSHYFFWGLRLENTVDLSNSSIFNPLGIIPFGGEATSLPGFLPFDLGSGMLGWILSFGIFFMIPKVGDMIKSMAEGKPFSAGTAIGEATGLARGAGATAVSGVGTSIVEKRIPVGGRPGPKEKGLQAAVDTLAGLIKGGR